MQISGLIKGLLAFGAGAAAGAGVTYLIINDKADQRVNEELARLEASYKPQEPAKKEKKEEEPKKAADLIDKASYDQYEVTLEKTNYAKTSKKPAKKKVKVATDIVSETPYIISPNLYDDDKLDYEKMKLTYFEKEDKYLDNRTDLIFEDGNNLFGDYVYEPNNWDDNETMWVRNDVEKIDAEITLNDEESIYDYCEENEE